jgi:hypothetical protein
VHGLTNVNMPSSVIDMDICMIIWLDLNENQLEGTVY